MTTEIVPHELQARVRRLLDDPTAELLFWCGNPVWAYIDVDGRRRELEEARPGRNVTPIERDGQPLAAIVHDAACDDGGRVGEVAATVGLEVERDNSLFGSSEASDATGRMQRQELTNLPVTTSDGRLAGLLLHEDAERALAAVKKS